MECLPRKKDCHNHLWQPFFILQKVSFSDFSLQKKMEIFYKLKDETLKKYNVFCGNVLTSVATNLNLILGFKNATKQENCEKK